MAGLFGSLGLEAVLPDGFEAPDVGGWLEDHPHVANFGQQVAGGLTVLAIGAILKRYMARQARLKAELSKAAEDAQLARAVLGPSVAPAYQQATDLIPRAFGGHGPMGRQEELAPSPFLLRDEPERRRDSLSSLLFQDTPYRDDIAKVIYGRR